MWICLDCQETFTNPKHCIDRCGLDTPPYYEYDACPYCGGEFVETYKCDGCGEWISGSYVKLRNGDRFCEECYLVYEIGEE